MKLEIPENAKEAVQFLIIGAGAVLVIRLLIAGIELFAPEQANNELQSAIGSFRNGYVLLAPNTLVVGGIAPIPRLAVGVLFAVFTALALALVIGILSTLIRISALRGAVLGARAGFILGGSWAVYALLMLPPMSSIINETGVTQEYRASFLKVIPFPFTERAKHIEWKNIEPVGTKPYDGCIQEIRIRVKADQSSYAIARHDETARPCGAAEHAQSLYEAEQLVNSLNSSIP